MIWVARKRPSERKRLGLEVQLRKYALHPQGLSGCKAGCAQPVERALASSNNGRAIPAAKGLDRLF